MVAWALDRFIAAQAPVFGSVMHELRAGSKRSHWMWFVFPQIAGLGRSDIARFYAIASLAEAQAYLAHPVLGPRLHECVATVMTHERLDAVNILGAVDATKLRSSLTLFEAAGGGCAFGAALDRLFGSERDLATFALLHHL